MQKLARKYQDSGLYPSEAEVARRLSQDPATWGAKAVVLERDGLPRIDPLLGGRFWPAVEAYFQRRHGLNSVSNAGPLVPDAMENFDAL